MLTLSGAARAVTPQSDETVDVEQELRRGFAAAFIKRKAQQLVRRPEFTRADLKDLEQEMKLFLWKRVPDFDPGRAHWNVFVTTLIERFAAQLLTNRTRKKRERTRAMQSLSEWVQDEEGRFVPLAETIREDQRLSHASVEAPCHEETVSRAMDLDTVLKALPPELRALCEQLKHDCPQQVARDRSIPRQTLQGRIREIRDAFAAAGFQEILSRFPALWSETR
jgi:hypothetical protein